MAWTKLEMATAGMDLGTASSAYMTAVLREDGSADTFEAHLRQKLTSVVRSILETLENDPPPPELLPKLTPIVQSILEKLQEDAPLY
jgi:hypothetical protein